MIINTIYKLEPVIKINNTTCVAKLIFNNKEYIGEANLNPKDEEFFSEKVGLNIALSRARILLLKDYYSRQDFEYKCLEKAYNEAILYGQRKPELIDPENIFFSQVQKARKKAEQLRNAVKIEKQELNKYLASLSKVFSDIQRIRKLDTVK